MVAIRNAQEFLIYVIRVSQIHMTNPNVFYLDDWNAFFAKLATLECIAGNYFRDLAQWLPLPISRNLCHFHAAKIRTTLAAMVCSNSRAWAFSDSSSSFKVSNLTLKSSSLTFSPGAKPT